MKKRQSSTDVPSNNTMLGQSESNRGSQNSDIDYEKGGPMPEDIRDMIGNTKNPSKIKKTFGALPKIKILRSPNKSSGKGTNILNTTSYKKHLLSPEFTPKRTTLKKDKKRQKLTSNETSLNEKFEQQKKRNIIGDFLNNPKPQLQDLILQPKSPRKAKVTTPKKEEDKALVVIEALTGSVTKTKEDVVGEDKVKLVQGKEQLPPKYEKEMKEQSKPETKSDKPKVDLFKVVLASAAAEVVNLKSKGNA